MISSDLLFPFDAIFDTDGPCDETSPLYLAAIRGSLNLEKLGLLLLF